MSVIPKDDFRPMAERLTKAIQRLGISNELAAEEAGVNETTLYRWIGAKTRTPLAVIRMFELMPKPRKKRA